MCVGAWLLAIRPATLTAAVAPVLVGTALAVRDGGFHAGAALAALVGAVLIQVGTNFANDVDDFQRGVDSSTRLGPPRVTQQGLLAASQVRHAAWLAFGGAGVAGLYLAAVGGWPIILLGLAAIASGLAYTGGPWPYGYHGLGDLFVFLFFGLAAVVGTYYVQAGTSSTLVWLAAVPIGALATAILVVNNTRDIDTDRAAGKKTLAVWLGRRGARGEFVGLIALAYAVPLGLWLVSAVSAWILLSWGTVPLAVPLLTGFFAANDGPSFNAVLRRTARLHALFGILFAAGLLA